MPRLPPRRAASAWCPSPATPRRLVTRRRGVLPRRRPAVLVGRAASHPVARRGDDARRGRTAPRPARHPRAARPLGPPNVTDGIEDSGLSDAPNEVHWTMGSHTRQCHLGPHESVAFRLATVFAHNASGFRRLVEHPLTRDRRLGAGGTRQHRCPAVERMDGPAPRPPAPRGTQRRSVPSALGSRRLGTLGGRLVSMSTQASVALAREPSRHAPLPLGRDIEWPACGFVLSPPLS